jgi:hypothetical protein
MTVGWVSTAFRKAPYWYNRFRFSAADPQEHRFGANVANGA